MEPLCRHAVFLVRLRGWQLVMTARLQFAVDDIVDSVGAPVRAVERGSGDDSGIIGARLHQGRHFDGLIVVMNHVLHVAPVRRGIARIGDPRGLFRGQVARVLARRAGLDDGRVLRGRRAARAEQAPATERNRMDLVIRFSDMLWDYPGRKESARVSTTDHGKVYSPPAVSEPFGVLCGCARGRACSGPRGAACTGGPLWRFPRDLARSPARVRAGCPFLHGRPR